MEKRTEGAWIINHTKKLGEVSGASQFEEIETAGKCGIFLSNLAASQEESELNKEVVSSIAQVSNIKKTELETVKKILADAHLIDLAKNGSISVLGITTASVLAHTADIFSGSKPNNLQKAALELSEQVSDKPKEESKISEYISDTYKLSDDDTNDLIAQAREIGFVDYESLDDDSKLYFNGNLFRRETLKKTQAVLNSLKSQEKALVTEVDELLNKKGCITFEAAKNILGAQLLEKLQSIGMYDFNEVSNPKETKVFITKPSAFSKFGNPFEEDAMDLAKAFVSALFYGMHFSSNGRGKIYLLERLMNKLLTGAEVGPATAIGQDYKILELQRVVQLRADGKTGKFYMKLLKRDVGELALQVLKTGDAVEQAIRGSSLYSGSVTGYVGPEKKRYFTRKKQAPESKTQIGNIIKTFRY